MEEYIGTVIKVGGILIGSIMVLFVIWYNPQIEMFAHFKTKSSFHKTKGII